MSYADIKTAIESAPLSFLPGLFICVVKTSLEKKVFKPGGAARIAKEVEDERNETLDAISTQESPD
jgi:hypothetical protein